MARPQNKHADILHAIAHALGIWAIVEAHLCSIFAVGVTATDYTAAAAAFSAILSFEAQIAMVDAAIGQKFNSDTNDHRDWKSIKKRLDKLRPARNRLAHGKVVPVVLKGGAMEWRYLPFYHFFTHKERDAFVHMNETDLKAIAAEFTSLVGTMATFGKRIGARQQINPGKLLER